MSRSFVVTGGGRGIGRALVERLLGAADTVVALELDRAALEWTEDRPEVLAVVGDAGDEAVAERAADLAQSAGTLSGWVNNAAVFRDASLESAPTREILDLIALSFDPVLVGVRHRNPSLSRRGQRRSHRQRLVAPGPAAGLGFAAVLDREGSGRRADPRGRGVGPRGSASTLLPWFRLGPRPRGAALGLLALGRSGCWPRT